MRITTLMTHRSTIASLGVNNNNINKYTNQLLSQKKVSRPSDDAISMTSILTSRSELSSLEQYTKNIDTAKSHLEAAENSVNQVQSIIARCLELATQGANGTYGTDSTTAIAEEFKALREQLGVLANSKFGDFYIFGGVNTNDKPYDATTGKWVANPGADKSVDIEISPGVYTKVNVSGEELFNGQGLGKNLFDVIDEITTALLNGDNAFVGEVGIKSLQECENQAIKSLAEIGSTMNRIEIIEARNVDFELSTKQNLSTKEDVDVEEVYIKLSAAKTAYQAGIAVTSNILQVSLLDYLR